MDTIEKKLITYRIRNQRKISWENYTSKMKTFFIPKAMSSNDFNIPEQQNKKQEKSNKYLINNAKPNKNDSPKDGNYTEENVELVNSTKSNKILHIIICLLWITIWAIAIKLQFGMVFLVISAIIAIYLNTGTSRKKRNELSAYSVFNKNFESIEGTLTAEHFEKQMLYKSNKFN